MKIGFIGTGNMAGAIAQAMKKESESLHFNTVFYDIDTAKARALADQLDACVSSGVQELISSCDVVIIAVKPGTIPSLLRQTRDVFIASRPLVISIAAGKSINFIEDLLDSKASVVRVMPNINAKVGQSMSAYCKNGNVSLQQEEAVKQIFLAAGRLIYLEENLFPLFGIIAGSAPAFAYMFIDSLARAAVKNGMAKSQALEIAAQTVLGSASLILQSGEHPWKLIDQVCSPGGTTIEGIAALQENGFETAVREAVDKALEKDRKI